MEKIMAVHPEIAQVRSSAARIRGWARLATPPPRGFDAR
jgi:hypothetical protein